MLLVCYEPSVNPGYGEWQNGDFGRVDASIVMTHMMLQAQNLGLGSCWIAREQEMFDSKEGQNLLKEWGLDGNYVGIAACLLGYPDGAHPAPAPRKPNYVIKIKS